jgi:type I restriction enzyme S subunit
MRNNWGLKELKDISQIFNGGTPKTNIKEYWDGDIFWITPKDLGKLYDVFILNTERKITTLGLQKSSAKVLPINSLILSSRAPIGHLAIAKIPISTNQGCKGIVIDEINNDVKYVFYFLKKSVALLNDLGTGTTFREISAGTLGKVQIPIPPLPEQQAIVEKLDFAFEAIEKAKANIEKNIQNAKELFQSKLNAVFENRNFHFKKLKDIFDVRDGTHDSPKYFDTGYPLITSKNLKNGELTFDKIKFIKEEDYININKRSKVHKGDILFAMIGTIGNPVVISEEPNFAIKNVALIKSNLQNSSYFYQYYLNSALVLKKMQNESKGATQKFVSLGYMRDFLVPNPDLETQQKIVAQLDQLSEQTNLLQEKYRQKLGNLEELKKSILERAFKGELV